MSARTWYGPQLNDWAGRWVSYWTGGQGVFAMSAEEDTGIMQALTQLAQDRRARLDRVLILRAASDYTVGSAGHERRRLRRQGGERRLSRQSGGVGRALYGGRAGGANAGRRLGADKRHDPNGGAVTSPAPAYCWMRRLALAMMMLKVELTADWIAGPSLAWKYWPLLLAQPCMVGPSWLVMGATRVSYWLSPVMA